MSYAVPKQVFHEEIKISSIEFDNTPLKTKRDILEPFFEPLYSANSIQSLSDRIEEISNGLTSLDAFASFNFEVKKLGEQRTSLNEPIPCVLVVKLKEKKSFNLTANTNVTTNLDSQVKLQAVYRNAFGRGEKISGNVNQNSTTGTDYTVSFTKPILHSKKINQIDASVFRFDRDYTLYSSHTEKVLGSSASVKSGHHKYTYECLLRDIELAPKATEAMLQEGGPHIKSSIKHEWQHDTRDNPIAPNEGHYVQIVQELAGLGGNVRHLKHVFVGQKIIQLKRDDYWILGLTTKFGTHFPLFGSRSFISDRFFLGGMGRGNVDTLRGFEEKGVGPRWGKDSYGGDIFYSGSANLSYPLKVFPFGVLKGQLFGEVGQLFSLPHHTKPWLTPRNSPNTTNQAERWWFHMSEGYRAVVGVGLVLATVVGLRLELNYTHPLFVGNRDKMKNFQFGISVDCL
eukprot:TRINITY_DN4581_c0_g1_i1.p1 TRINITY_DN4581_c0_g1~~TRINITY_DN4581_c0_g1_i1.p1  ORF type:complete len:456 (+),score=61.50 TRINITY_DN4581_c0_g1_i1:3-1370(+)